MTREWSIQEVARATGTTSRTLRHYDAVGLLTPARTGTGGYRLYTQAELVRLQQILLLRGFGMGLTRIAEVLDARVDPALALQGHIAALRQEQIRLDRRIASVERTLTAVTRGEQIMPETMFDGFDHAQHEDEVRERWGDDAWESGQRWWESQTPESQQRFQRDAADLATDWQAAAGDGADPAGERGQQLARRQVEWLTRTPSVPGGEDFWSYLACLGDMYVEDERFAAAYGGPENAAFVRDALKAHAGRHG